MKTRIFLVSFAFAALALVSCSKNEVVENNYSPDRAISFSTYLTTSPVSKAAVTTTVGIQAANAGFGITAVHTETTAWKDATTKAPNFMYNQQVTYVDGTKGWTYSPVKYWPTKKESKVSFFAYAPYVATSATAPATGIILNNNTTDPSTLTFKLATASNETVDFVADCDVDQTGTISESDPATGSTPAPVDFTLFHELTRVAMVAKVSDNVWVDSDTKNQTKVVITSAKLNSGNMYHTGTYSFNTTDGTKRGSWTLSDDMELPLVLNTANITAGQYSATGIELLAKNIEYQLLKESATGENYVFLLPPNGESGLVTSTKEVAITFTYDIVTVDTALSDKYSKTTATKVVKLPATTLAQGKAYKYTFTFGVDEVVVSATVQEWGDNVSGSGNVNYVTPES